jgi:hypothetical protein
VSESTSDLRLFQQETASHRWLECAGQRPAVPVALQLITLADAPVMRSKASFRELTQESTMKSNFFNSALAVLAALFVVFMGGCAGLPHADGMEPIENYGGGGGDGPQ